MHKYVSHIEGETSEKGAREQRLTKLFGPQWVEERGEWRRLHNEQLYDLSPLQILFRSSPQE
jgi:hypothetical protein